MAKILIVDDSSFMRTLLKNTLKKANIASFAEAENGKDAIDKFKKEKPDLVLLDIIMEKKDGVEALKAIKKVSPKAKVIMITAVGQEQMVREAMKSGAEDYIVKPFNSAKVVATVKKALK